MEENTEKTLYHIIHFWTWKTGKSTTQSTKTVFTFIWPSVLRNILASKSYIGQLNSHRRHSGYSPFYKTLPKYSWKMPLASVRFYEIGDIWIYIYKILKQERPEMDDFDRRTILKRIAYSDGRTDGRTGGLEAGMTDGLTDSLTHWLTDSRTHGLTD